MSSRLATVSENVPPTIVQRVPFLEDPGTYQFLRKGNDGGWGKSPQQEIGERVSKPESDDEFPILEIEGHYRLVRRMDGKFDATVWSYETENAEEWYDQRKREGEQREEMESMSSEELEAELDGQTNRLDALDTEELQECQREKLSEQLSDLRERADELKKNRDSEEWSRRREELSKEISALSEKMEKL